MNGSEGMIASRLNDYVSKELDRAGILFRVFSRAKSVTSIEDKISKKNYRKDGKKMQDLFGIRVVLYFPADSEIAQEALKERFEWLEADSTVDLPSMATFGPTRCNLVFSLPDELAQMSQIVKTEDRIDSTFEVQFRTVSSEGWHEIEHDLRYKNRDPWDDHLDLDRSMNGIIATLEMCDWSIESVLDELAYRNYKDKDWNSMIRNKFRLRFQGESLSDELIEIFNNDSDLSKKFFRVDRKRLLTSILRSDADFPLNANNIVYCANELFINSSEVSALVPIPLVDEFASVERSKK